MIAQDRVGYINLFNSSSIKMCHFFLLKSAKQKEKPDIFSGGDYSCLATVEGIELSKEELRGDLVPCGKSEKFRNNF